MIDYMKVSPATYGEIVRIMAHEQKWRVYLFTPQGSARHLSWS